MAVEERVLREPFSGARTAERSASGGIELGNRVRHGLRVAGKQARRNPVAAASLLFLLAMSFCAIFAPLVSPYSPLAIAPLHRLETPNAAHLLGTDNLGRDVLARIIYGARTSLYVGAATVLLGTAAGVMIGLVTGYFGGLVDVIFQRVMDAMQAFPGLIFALALISVLGASTNNVVLAIAFFIAPSDARVVRSAVLRVKSLEYVQASRAVGCGDVRIMVRHVLPNIVGPITIIASIAFGVAVLAEATLSFLGLGTPPPNPSWGSMLAGSGRQFMEKVPTLALFPGLAIAGTVLSLNLIGDALRDHFDPRTRKA